MMVYVEYQTRGRVVCPRCSENVSFDWTDSSEVYNSVLEDRFFVQEVRCPRCGARVMIEDNKKGIQMVYVRNR